MRRVFIYDFIINSELNSVFVVPYQVYIEYEIFSGKEVEYEYYQNDYPFYEPYVTAKHCVADKIAKRCKRQPDQSEQQEFNKTFFVSAYIAVLIHEKYGHHIVEQKAEKEPEYYRCQINRSRRPVRNAVDGSACEDPEEAVEMRSAFNIYYGGRNYKIDDGGSGSHSHRHKPFASRTFVFQKLTD